MEWMRLATKERIYCQKRMKMIGTSYGSLEKNIE